MISEKRLLPDSIAAIGYILRIDRQLYKEYFCNQKNCRV